MKQTWLLLLSLFFTLSLQAAEPPPYDGDEPSWMQQQEQRQRTLSDPDAWRVWQRLDLDEMKARARSASGPSIASQGGGRHKQTMRRRPAPVPTAPPQTRMPGVLSPPLSSTSSNRSNSSMSGGGSVNVFFHQDDQQQELLQQQRQRIAELEAALRQQQQHQLQPVRASEAAALEITLQTGEHLLPPEVKDLLTRLRTEFAAHVAASAKIKTTAENYITDRIRKQTQQQPPHKWKRPLESTEHHQSRERAALEELRKSSTGRIAALVHTLHTTNKALGKSTRQ